MITSRSRVRARRVGGTLLALWRLARPAIWMVSLLPFLVGHLLATRSIVPEQLVDFGLAVLVIGPLVWAAALLVNDVEDLSGDRRNPRRATSPLVLGKVSERFARRAAYGIGASAIGLSPAVNGAFAGLVVVFLAMAWAYSVPPLRLKTRPGADVVVNALAIGGVVLLAGWAVARPLPAFPWVFLPQGLLVTVAVYVPSTLVDLDADRAAGYRTVATRLGARRAYLIGWWAWVASNAGAVGFAAVDVVMPRAMLPVLTGAVPGLLLAYDRLIGRARSPQAIVRGIVVTSLLFLAVNTVFIVVYVVGPRA